MKKYILRVLCVMAAVLSLSACGGKKDTTPDGGKIAESTKEETNPDNGLPLSKQPDPNAPVLASIVIYAPVGEDGKIGEWMEAAEEMTGESIVELLIEKGTLAEGATFVSVEESDSEETIAAGPGGEGAKVKNATVTLSGFAAGEGLSEDTAKQAVIDTFRENYEYGEVTLVLA